MSKEKNRQTLGKNLSLGSIVRLSGLTSAKGQKMNEAVAEILGGIAKAVSTSDYWKDRQSQIPILTEKLFASRR